jgi:hypothetical protein
MMAVFSTFWLSVDYAESLASAVSFEFEEADIEGGISLPAGTDGVLNCGCDHPSGWAVPSIRIGFADSVDGSDVWADLGTGKAIGQALAALVGCARSSTLFRFSDDGLATYRLRASPLGHTRLSLHPF